MNITALSLPASSKLAFSLKLRFSLKTFLIISGLIIGFLLVFYVFQINAEASERHLIKNYEINLTEIIREKQILEINLVQTNSLDNIISLVDRLNFEKIDKIHYIRVVGGQIVAR